MNPFYTKMANTQTTSTDPPTPQNATNAFLSFVLESFSPRPWTLFAIWTLCRAVLLVECKWPNQEKPACKEEDTKQKSQEETTANKPQGRQGRRR
ncbi:hypothetical protein N7499_002286 [Penicillium canescens]|uniref:Uncharacterized protein n=1 Tax=Penicillium canescens TaxID=5083 RepID=A0AAD6I7C6_PENCN|nr:uncharacterized protein N7446_009829 [Penicillium canescens]KAJ6035068.1 hypothetical protein N7460_009243 [Penicillium canescens]KAJ6053817.1 hypothetical protein N7446_009829 [Penicillium canescens]KAJ6097912.1 hypothetical protein N7499_002286 [Penicillium canescens]KAJ6165901.1 hypothetical protein N7485_009145 [Penicillium canescens]